jgi:hypothetical protein
MAYLKPPAFARHLANPLAMHLSAGAVATLTVVRRCSGEVPVIPVKVGRSSYLVCPYGESDWVRNLRATGNGELSGKGRTEVFRATEVPLDQRRPVSRAIARLPGAVSLRASRSCPTPRDHSVFEISQMHDRE